MPGGTHPPLEVVQSWPTPNYINPITRPNTVLLLACICGPITVATLLARLWVRIFLQRTPGWDDWLMLIATVRCTFLMTAAELTIADTNPFDRHVWDTEVFRNPEKIVLSRKYVLAILCFFCTTSGLIKVSILLFYRRLSARAVSNNFRWATWLSIGFIVAYTIALTLAPLFGCNPISAFWDQGNPIWVKQGHKFHCFDEGADIFVAGLLSAIQDFITAILPSFLYWNLQISLRQKIPLIGIFALGYGVVALASLRAYYCWRIYYDTYDVSWETWKLFVVTMLELHVGAFCANAPAMKVFFWHFFRHKFPSGSRTTGRLGHKSRDISGSTRSRTDRSNSSVLGKVACLFSKENGSHVKTGYISEPGTGFSVDAHGGVQVQKEVHITHSRPPTIGTSANRNGIRDSIDSTDVICNRNYDGIELSQYISDTNSRASSL
ncbi:hypothetical protein P153DRAFT_341421 [Dothidotthia symphoricarpi CBS 119687]|uniref:Rhodopsin domain-containing protein n=1 Tax=Dothidotthia symphoricarpi CBS 119687 TaxID=1392245 RepID=A0A6A6ADP6_9PLEO|nr:uncharacterized protein P153DRAFT_341421 [Dothidotthia symphoricarpi CBS 119687]KAF2129007.1 hypothetical protein P153DRAFT_341421 [Dothidotthia symphoricarpi CBS 119687]